MYAVGQLHAISYFSFTITVRKCFFYMHLYVCNSLNHICLLCIPILVIINNRNVCGYYHMYVYIHTNIYIYIYIYVYIYIYIYIYI